MQGSFYKEIPVATSARKASPRAKVFPHATPRFKTLTEFNEHRKLNRKAHPSFDLNKDGGVSQREYFLASKFDSNKDGVLDADEMQVAQAAFDKGFGQDDFRKYFSFKRPNMTRLDRVLMKTSRTERTSYADTFNRILTDYGTRNNTMFKAPTPPEMTPPNTGTRLWRERRTRLTQSNIETKALRDERMAELDRIRQEQTPKTLRYRDGFVESPRHSTRGSLMKERWDTARPHSSYDLDGDGVVSPRDYYLAKKFSGELKDKHMLSEAERARALSAVAEGLGKDSMETYFSFRQQAKPLTRSQKVLQKTFPVQTKSFSQTYERVLGQYSTRNDMLQTSAWSSTAQESMFDGISSRANTVVPPRQSGGWAGVPGPCAPKGHNSSRQ